jgi:phospholipid transport system substrate-binding protein
MLVLRKYTILLCALGFAPFADSACGAQSDPAALQVQSLDTALLKSMRAGATLAIADRYQSLAPVVEQVFDLPLMTRICVGPGWETFSPAQQAASIAAFTRLTIASYAVNFHEFDGEKFEIDANVASHGADKVVLSHLLSPHEAPVSLVYRMRELGGTWKIIDVSYDGVSELSLRRSDFAAAVASGGAPTLLAHLSKLSDDLMKR